MLVYIFDNLLLIDEVLYGGSLGISYLLSIFVSGKILDLIISLPCRPIFNLLMFHLGMFTQHAEFMTHLEMLGFDWCLLHGLFTLSPTSARHYPETSSLSQWDLDTWKVRLVERGSSLGVVK